MHPVRKIFVENFFLKMDLLTAYIKYNSLYLVQLKEVVFTVFISITHDKTINLLLTRHNEFFTWVTAEDEVSLKPI